MYLDNTLVTIYQQISKDIEVFQMLMRKHNSYHNSFHYLSTFIRTLLKINVSLINVFFYTSEGLFSKNVDGECGIRAFQDGKDHKSYIQET